MPIRLTRPGVNQGRWITPYHGGIAATSQTFTVGRVYLAMFEILTARSCDGMSYVVGAASTGSVTGGIYGPIAAGADTCAGAAVAAQSASTAQGTATGAQLLTWTAVTLQPGVYYVALEGDNVLGTYARQGNQTQATGMAQIYDRAGGYGALTDPCPAITETGSAIPGMRVRLA